MYVTQVMRMVSKIRGTIWYHNNEKLLLGQFLFDTCLVFSKQLLQTHHLYSPFLFKDFGGEGKGSQMFLDRKGGSLRIPPKEVVREAGLHKFSCKK